MFLKKRAVVPRRAHSQGAETFASLNSRLDNDKEEEEFPNSVVLLLHAVLGSRFGVEGLGLGLWDSGED